jgi:hypothetical protein
MSLLVLAPIAIGSSQKRARSSSCAIGESRTLDPDLFRPDRVLTDSFMVACVHLNVGVSEVVAARAGRSLKSSDLCVLTPFGDGSSAGVCQDPRPRVRGLHFDLGGEPGHFLYFSGFVPESFAKVVLRYRIHGRVRSHSGHLTRVSRPDLLSRLALRRPFSFYGADATVRARDFELVARNKARKVIDRLFLGDLKDVIGGSGEVLGKIKAH